MKVGEDFLENQGGWIFNLCIDSRRVIQFLNYTVFFDFLGFIYLFVYIHFFFFFFFGWCCLLLTILSNYLLIQIVTSK